MYKRILLAVDGSDNSLRAADEAVKMASINENSVVELLYVVDFDKVKSDVLHSSSQVALEHSRRGHLIPYEDKLKENNINYELKILNKYPDRTISKYVIDYHIRMSTLGSR